MEDAKKHSRRMVDYISDHLFAPTGLVKRSLEEKRVLGQISVTGNTVIDVIEELA